MAPQMLDAESEQEAAVEVTWDDQTNINNFSKLNNRLSDVEEELTKRQEEKEHIEDLVLELELADEDEPVLYKMGECFLHLPLNAAQKRLEKDQAVIDGKIAELTTKKRECEKGMGELKVKLYARFGTAINLET